LHLTFIFVRYLLVMSEGFVGFAALKPYVPGQSEPAVQLYEFESRPLRPDDVEVEVAACGM
jgi:hypothetical protein